MPMKVYKDHKDKPYQVIVMAADHKTNEDMVVYQRLYGDFRTYVAPLKDFVELINYYPTNKTYEISSTELSREDEQLQDNKLIEAIQNNNDISGVDSILIDFLDANTYSKKLDIINSNLKRMNNGLIDNMAASLDHSIEEGDISQRVKELINCLQAMARFEDRRLRS